MMKEQHRDEMQDHAGELWASRGSGAQKVRSKTRAVKIRTTSVPGKMGHAHALASQLQDTAG